MHHLPGERRRAIALASLVTLAIYLIFVALAQIPNFTFTGGVARLTNAPMLEQLALLAFVWVGMLLVALAQRQLISHGEGGYVALLAITQVPGMRGPGLIGGLVLAGVVVLGAAFGILPERAGVALALASLYLLALGLPNAPAARYVFTPAFGAAPIADEYPASPRRMIDATR